MTDTTSTPMSNEGHGPEMRVVLLTCAAALRDGQTEDFASHSHHVLLQTMQLFGTKDFQEGLLSFVEKRPPEFRGC